MATGQLLLSKASPPFKLSKRLFDIFFSSLMLLALTPLLLIIIVVIKLTSRGPVFFKGLRLGQGGKLISLWKFRTMDIDAKESLNKILAENSALKHEWTIYQKLKNDPRITKYGKFLRRYSIDELPQFWNVLKGDLSVVGPRPLEIYDTETAYLQARDRFEGLTDKILSARPGITCLWQTKGRSHLTTKEQIRFEKEYIDRQSFWLDLIIICKTVYIVIFAKGAF